jgi:hypothetical protein
MPSAAHRASPWPGWRAAARVWGPAGNKRLTASTGLVLLVLLAVEASTTLALRSYLSVHIFLGLLLLPPVALKLATTGWRFLRYYTRDKGYRLGGPPSALLRVLAPFLVVSTVSLFGSGVGLIVVGHGGGALLTVHSLSFVVWGPLMLVHLVAYLRRALHGGAADWRRRADAVVDGARSRRALLVSTLLAGVVLGAAIYPIQHFRGGGHDDPRARTSGTVAGVALQGSFVNVVKTMSPSVVQRSRTRSGSARESPSTRPATSSRTTTSSAAGSRSR